MYLGVNKRFLLSKQLPVLSTTLVLAEDDDALNPN